MPSRLCSAGSINTTTKHFSMLIKHGFSLAATPVDVDYSSANVLPTAPNCVTAWACACSAA